MRTRVPRRPGRAGNGQCCRNRLAQTALAQFCTLTSWRRRWPRSIFCRDAAGRLLDCHMCLQKKAPPVATTSHSIEKGINYDVICHSVDHVCAADTPPAGNWETIQLTARLLLQKHNTKEGAHTKTPMWAGSFRTCAADLPLITFRAVGHTSTTRPTCSFLSLPSRAVEPVQSRHVQFRVSQSVIWVRPVRQGPPLSSLSHQGADRNTRQDHQPVHVECLNVTAHGRASVKL